ncbi:MAG: SDR family NAD(P)-dependent oxidoreductase [Myxococcales bacterium]|nr:SDR family NAD(P)-dependent oxidoreductase [Myxococcales bacterium]
MRWQPTSAGKVAIVTGAASGIGRALAGELALAGADVVLADIDEPGAVAAASDAATRGGRAEAVRVDVTDAAAVEALVTRVGAERGRLDFMFNNAGIAFIGDTLSMTLEDWNRIIDVNLRGVVHGVRAAYAYMAARGDGHIVNTASVSGLIPAPGFTAYAASKHAVVGLSVSLRAEAAPRGVRVSCACPGFIDTPLKHHAKVVGLDREAVTASLARLFASADDCARAILRGVAKNQGIIVVTGHARFAHAVNRLAPGLVARLAERLARRAGG